MPRDSRASLCSRNPKRTSLFFLPPLCQHLVLLFVLFIIILDEIFLDVLIWTIHIRIVILFSFKDCNSLWERPLLIIEWMKPFFLEFFVRNLARTSSLHVTGSLAAWGQVYCHLQQDISASSFFSFHYLLHLHHNNPRSSSIPPRNSDLDFGLFPYPTSIPFMTFRSSTHQPAPSLAGRPILPH